MISDQQLMQLVEYVQGQVDPRAAITLIISQPTQNGMGEMKYCSNAKDNIAIRNLSEVLRVICNRKVQEEIRARENKN